jgi:hypothetical protein
MAETIHRLINRVLPLLDQNLIVKEQMKMK